VFYKASVKVRCRRRMSRRSGQRVPSKIRN